MVVSGAQGRILLIGLLALAVAGCSRSDTWTPEEAREQKPITGLSGEWRAEGRVAVEGMGRRMSSRLLLRQQGDTLSAAMVEDTGPVLLQIEASADGYRVVRGQGDLKNHAEAIAKVFYHSFGQDFDGPPGGWEGGTYVWRGSGYVHHFGGDPVLLRRIHLGSWTIDRGDFRLIDGRLVTHRVEAKGPYGITVTMTLGRWVADDGD